MEGKFQQPCAVDVGIMFVVIADDVLQRCALIVAEGRRVTLSEKSSE